MSSHPGEARLMRYALDELEGADRLRIETHLAACAICRRRIAGERQLDEWIVESSPRVDAGHARRSLQRLWERVDAEAAPEAASAVPSRWRPILILRYVAAAALIAWLILLVEPTGEDVPVAEDAGVVADGVPAPAVSAGRDAPTRGRPVGASSGEAPPEAPSAAALDAVRLAAALDEVATVLATAHARLPHGETAFHVACEDGLARLRREGWPVGTLVRRHLRGSDPELARAALRYAAGSAATLSLVAEVLEDPRLGDEALARLARPAMDIGSSASLVRALERCARADEAWTRQRALALLASAGPRGRRSLDRLADALLTRPSPALDGPLLWAFVEEAPADLAIETLWRAGAVAAWRTAAAQRYLALAAQHPEQALAGLDRLPVEPAARRDVLAWLAAARPAVAGPWLLAELERDPADEQLLACAAVVGGAEVVAGLFELGAEGLGADALRWELAALLLASPQAAFELGRGCAVPRLADLVQLAEQLDPPARGRLLLGAVEGWEPGAPDLGGHRAGLLGALGRLGGVAEGEALLAWLADRPGEDPLAPLAWVAASHLAPEAALATWAASGRDPDLLAAVSTAAADRLLAAVRPSDRLLAPLRRTLLRAGSPEPLPIGDS